MPHTGDDVDDFPRKRKINYTVPLDDKSPKNHTELGDTKCPRYQWLDSINNVIFMEN